MIVRLLQKVGARSQPAYAMSLGSIVLCLGLWIRAKTVDQDVRGNAERRAMFVGLWPATIWLIGKRLEEAEQDAGRWRRLRRARA